MKYLIGIDEAGRGPLAGPLAVGVVCSQEKPLPHLPKKLKDSKQLSAVEREAWFLKIKAWQKKGILNYKVALVSAGIIDRVGIVQAIKYGIYRGIKRLQIFPPSTSVFLDGGLKAPSVFLNQKTIIRGDEKVPLIALASIAAKVTRDRKMTRLHFQFPKYGFDIHKGYGTLFHRKAIRLHGPCALHRRTFIRTL